MGQESEAAPEGQEPEAAAPETDNKAPSKGRSFDAEYVSQLRSEAARHRKEAQEAKAKIAEYEEANQSELEKISGKLSKAEQRAQEAEANLLRFQVGAEKKLDPDLLPFLTGSSKEELEAKADVLLSKVAAAAPDPEFDGGAREPADDPKTPEQQHDEFMMKLLGRNT